MDGVALFCAGLTLETYVTGAPNPVKCSASCGRGISMASETPLSDVRFLTVAEVALIMRVSKMTVYRLVHSGELEAIRVGRSFRVPESAVNQYLRAAFVGTGLTGPRPRRATRPHAWERMPCVRDADVRSGGVRRSQALVA